MARKKDSEGNSKKELLETARERWKRCMDADQDNRRLAIDDMRFLHEPGFQWDPDTKKARGKRPCYEFNRLRVSVKRVVNDIRANRPQGKVRAVEDGDKSTASVIEGLIRNVWNVSDADAAVDTAAEYQVGGGMGAWRVKTKYADDSAWDQDIEIEPIRNPFALWADPAARDPMNRDASFWFLESRINEDDYEAKYGDVPAIEWESSEFDDDDEWEDDDRIRICEYWYREPYTKKVVLLSNGETIDAEQLDEALAAGQQVMRERDVQAYRIKVAIISGDKVLEGPTDWAGSKFPFVQVYGEYVVIDGKPKWWGLTRFGKDAQRLHNYNMTHAAETVALSPQAQWWATTEQAKGHIDLWKRSTNELIPFLTYNPDPQSPGPPQRMAGPQIPAAFLQMGLASGEEIKAVTGIFDASLGQTSNEQTGIAIRARQQQGEIATFNYSDNIARGIRYTWELLIDLIPKIYDTARSVRILGTDGAEQYAQVNTIGPDGEALNDLSRGKYDVTVTVGPSFSTQRQEAAETYIGLSQGNPQVMGVAGDLIFKSLDLPYAEDMAERMRAILPPPIQQMLQAKDQSGGKPLPPEAMHAMQQAQQAMAMVQQQSQIVQQAAAEADGMKSEAEKAASDLETKRAQLNADYQRMLADLAKKEAALVLKEANLVAKATQDGATSEAQAVQSDREALATEVQAAVAEIQKGVAEFMTQAAAALAQVAQSNTPQVVVANQPRRKTVSMVGPGGRTYSATVDEQ